MLADPDEGAASVRTAAGAAMPSREPLRLMAVHAHPDDESSKGAATMARYVKEGVEVLIAELAQPVAELRAQVGLHERNVVEAKHDCGLPYKSCKSHNP